LSDTGKGYNALRKEGYPVTIPAGTFESVLKKYGIEMKNGEILIDEETPPLSSADISALNDFYNQYGNKTTLSSNAFLNARQGLDKLKKYDAAKTQLPEIIAGELRKTYDSLGKNQITETTGSPSLESLDTEYSAQIKPLKPLIKDYLNRDGSLKDGAENKIANLTGTGKTQVLARLESASPGITKEINIVKAMEDVQNTQGQKVGTYMRGALGAGGILTGNPLAIIAAVITSPSVFVPLLKAFGNAKGVNVAPTISRVLGGLKMTPLATAIILSAAKFTADQNKD
jgi:hypothetical protein